MYHVRTMTLLDYVFSAGNIVDWAHLGMSIYAWLLWLFHIQMTYGPLPQPFSISP